MPEPIIFYDIPSRVKHKAWSPTTWKTRLCLNIKGIPYKTVWVEFPDIEALYKKLGAPAAGKKRDGSPSYTLPLIHDPNTNSIVADSAAIARYLDKAYPETKPLISEEADALFQAAFSDTPRAAIAGMMTAPEWAILREKSQVYFRQTREAIFGKLEDLAPPGSEKRAEHWKAIEESLHKTVTGWLEAEGKDKLFFMGREVGITYPDIHVAAFLLFFRAAYGEDSQEWKDIMTWDGGRWARFMAAFEKYEVVDEGEEVQL